MKRINYNYKWLCSFFLLNIVFGIVSFFLMKKNYNCVVPIYMWLPTWFIIIGKKTDAIKKINIKIPSLSEALFCVFIGFVLLFIPYILYILFVQKSVIFRVQINHWVFQIIVDIIATSLLVMGEEIAWRCVLYEEFKVITTRSKSIFLVGTLWAVWHIPLIGSGNYYHYTIKGSLMFFFLINAILINNIFFIIKEKNFIILILIHSTTNVIYNYSDNLIIVQKNSQYYIGETGVFTIIVCFFVILFYKQFNGDM